MISGSTPPSNANVSIDLKSVTLHLQCIVCSRYTTLHDFVLKKIHLVSLKNVSVEYILISIFRQYETLKYIKITIKKKNILTTRYHF